jgi:hypothetical protein
MMVANMVRFKAANGESLSGERLVIPGYEDMDVIAVADGFQKKLFELTTGLEIAVVHGFSEEEIITSLVDQLNAKKFNVQKLMQKIYNSDVLRVGNEKRWKINDSPSYSSYKENRLAEEQAKPFIYTEEERKQIIEVTIYLSILNVKGAKI